MTIPTDRLREIADGAMGIGAPLVLTQAEQVAVCTELLALRDAMSLPGYTRLVEERDAARAELEQWPRQIAAALNATAHIEDRSPATAGWLRDLTAELAKLRPYAPQPFDDSLPTYAAMVQGLADTEAELAKAQAATEQARREGQEIAAGLHERIAAVEAERDALRAKLEAWCRTGGKHYVPTPGSSDSFGDGVRQAQREVQATLDAAERQGGA